MKQAKKILQKYLAGEATDEEKALVESWYVQEPSKASDLKPAAFQEEHDRGLKQLQQHIKQKRQHLLWPIIRVAAILTILIAGVFVYIDRSAKDEQLVTTQKSNDVLPGGNKALLTLADGTQISLTDAATGELMKEGNTAIVKTADGELTYQAPNTGAAEMAGAALKYNTLTTPLGGQYKIILPDGSKAWLNAGSSLKFPATFAKSERRVELSGEAYFEIMHNAAKPFLVSANGSEIKVLGTHFNVSAYAEDEQLTTTLLEGAVEVRNEHRKALLKPGQRAQISSGNNNIQVEDTDVSIAVAWKNGYFEFKRANIKDIMKQLSRWYDIDVIYEGRVPEDEFVGKIRRSVTLSQALKMLQLSQIKFRIEGRKIFITG